jgi:hypothetical protein
MTSSSALRGATDMADRFWLALAAGALVPLLGGAAHAQDDGAQISPIEVLTCRFAEGKGAGDLDGLAGAFNSWMERSRAPEYAAYALLPQAYSGLDFDLAWIGQWRDGATMGESMAHYFANGAELGAAFDSAMSCDSNRNFSVVTVREPVQPGRFGPLEVATCTLRLGVPLDDALAGVDEWVSYVGTTGSTSAHWLLFPAYGERSDARYHFKWAIGYASYPAFGRDYDQLTSGASLDKYNELFGGVMECDSPRLYSVRTIRAPQD